MPSNSKRDLVIPMLLLVIGAGWFLTSLLLAVLEWAPASRDYFHWFWLLVLGAGALLSLALRRLDRGSVVVGLALLLAGLLMVLRFTRGLSLDAADFFVPLPVIGIGGLTLFVQLSAVSPPTADEAWSGDPLRQPCNRIGCGITVASLLLSGLSAFVAFANAMAMEGGRREVEVVSGVGAVAGAVLAVLGCIVALIRRPAATPK
jgi:hypothetical protein